MIIVFFLFLFLCMVQMTNFQAANFHEWNPRRHAVDVDNDNGLTTFVNDTLALDLDEEGELYSLSLYSHRQVFRNTMNDREIWDREPKHAVPHPDTCIDERVRNVASKIFAM